MRLQGKCLRLQSAWIYVHNFLFLSPDSLIPCPCPAPILAPKNKRRGTKFMQTITGSKAKGKHAQQPKIPTKNSNFLFKK